MSLASKRLAAIDSSLRRAVSFLRRSQLPHGEFATVISNNENLTDGLFDSSPFVTTFVLYSLLQLHDPDLNDVINKGLFFLDEQREIGGLWRYYSSRQYKRCRIPPDLDDTACASFALQQAGRRVPNNEWAFKYLQDKEGRFLTWFVAGENTRPSFQVFLYRALGEFQARCHQRLACRPAFADDPRLLNTAYDPVPSDDVDPIVNANAILLLGERELTKGAIDYLLHFVPQARDGEFSSYYREKLVLLYMVTRAFRHSAPSLGALKDVILSDVQARGQTGDLPRSALAAAMAASMLITFQHGGALLDEMIEAILSLQQPDGSWKQQLFYSGPSEYWGSRELTTAFCIEALARYREYQPSRERPSPANTETHWSPDDVLTGPEGVDAEWYAACYTDVADAASAALHYAQVGWREDRDPNPNYPTAWYLRANPDSVLTGPEGVDAEWYVARYPDVADSAWAALHYAYVGWREGRDPNPNFSTAWYLKAYPDVSADGINPFVHYLLHGRKEGRSPVEPEAHWNPDGVLTGHEGVDAEWYAAHYPDVAGAESAAFHYAHVGWREGKNPNPNFSTVWYLKANPDIAADEINPFVHYLLHGRGEGRSPFPPRKEIVRWRDWWPGKITPALAMSFATALWSDVSIISNFWTIVTMVVGIAACAAYVSVINDLCDAEQDELSGKPNALKGKPASVVCALLVGNMAVGLCCCIAWYPDYVATGCYLGSWISFSLYSLRPTRLKERALLGTVADAFGAHVFPALLASLLVVHSQSDVNDPLWLGLVGLWSFCYGLRSIVSHQVADERDDAASDINTYVRSVGRVRAAFVSEWILLPIEALAFAVILAKISSIIVLGGLVFYGVMVRAGQFVRSASEHSESLVLLNSYYVVTFPTTLLVASIPRHPTDIILVPLFLLILSSEFTRRSVAGV